MEKFRKYEKQALDLHTKKKEEREENEKKRKDRLAQKKMEEQVLNPKPEATITELTDDEALKLQKEIDQVCVISPILALIEYFFNLVILIQVPALLSGMRLASASVIFYTSWFM